MRTTTIIAMHEVGTTHLAEVAREMETLGRPTIRAIIGGGYLLAIEGTHRMAAAGDYGFDVEVVADVDAGEGDVVIDGEDGPITAQDLLEALVSDGGPTGASYDCEID